MGRRSTAAAAVVALVLVAASCDARLVGDNSQGQLGTSGAVSEHAPDVGESWGILEAGTFHTCGITGVRELWCWGDNGRGQVGNGTTSGDQLTPVQVGSAADWQKVAPGYRHTCGIRAGEMWCWGSDTFGQLGNGSATTGSQGAPVRVGVWTDWVEVTSGRYHSCGIRELGGLATARALYCWGSNAYGQLGLGDEVDRTVPTIVVDGVWADVDAGADATCGITTEDGELYCWGSNSDGQLGYLYYAIGEEIRQPVHPVPQQDGRQWDDVSIGDGTACAVRAPTVTEPWPDSDVWCWGQNDDGEVEDRPLGADPRTPAVMFPENIFFWEGLEIITRWSFGQVSVGGDHVCAVQVGYITGYGGGGGTIHVTEAESDRRVPRCWGSDADGQLALDEPALSGGTDETWSVSAGHRHSLALTFEPLG